MNEDLLKRLRNFVKDSQAEMLALLQRLVKIESPTTVPDAQAEILTCLHQELMTLDLSVHHVPGVDSGGYLVAEPRNADAYSGKQLLVGHCDTVWPLGTIKNMPFSIADNIGRGPGIFDMKSGLTQIIYALKAIKEMNLVFRLAPLILINSDEETGSQESKQAIMELAQKSERAFILEPALGPEGRIKTERKGVGRFTITVHGKAAHAGLAPEKGSSAVLELSHLIQKLYTFNDPERGISVNVGKIEGGVQPNVVAPTSRAFLDVRVPSAADMPEVERAIFGLQPTTPGTWLEIFGGFNRPPLEKTAANLKLWNLAKRTALSFDLHLEEGAAGGGSDGNFTSQFTATIDGLGAVGDGAHADHEFIYIDKLVERTILLALLILEPSLSQ